MLNVTDKAAESLQESLDTRRENDGDVLRLTRSGDQFGLVVSQPQGEDQVVQHDERTVLVLDPDVSEALDGLTLDAVETPDGVTLTIEEPQI